MLTLSCIAAGLRGAVLVVLGALMMAGTCCCFATAGDAVLGDADPAPAAARPPLQGPGGTTASGNEAPPTHRSAAGYVDLPGTKSGRMFYQLFGSRGEGARRSDPVGVWFHGACIRPPHAPQTRSL